MTEARTAQQIAEDLGYVSVEVAAHHDETAYCRNPDEVHNLCSELDRLTVLGCSIDYRIHLLAVDFWSPVIRTEQTATVATDENGFPLSGAAADPERNSY